MKKNKHLFVKASLLPVLPLCVSCNLKKNKSNNKIYAIYLLLFSHSPLFFSCCYEDLFLFFLFVFENSSLRISFFLVCIVSCCVCVCEQKSTNVYFLVSTTLKISGVCANKVNEQNDIYFFIMDFN